MSKKQLRFYLLAEILLVSLITIAILTVLRILHFI